MPLREEAQIINQLKLTKIDKLLLLIANYAGKNLRILQNEPLQ